MNFKTAIVVMVINLVVALAVGRSQLPLALTVIAALELFIAALAALPVAGPRPGLFAEYRFPVIQSESAEFRTSRRRVSLTLAACSLVTLLLALLFAR